MATTRDPLSVLWDGAARALLERAYAAKGEWVATRVADPSSPRLAAAGRMPDNVSARGGHGGLDAKDRWRRAFVRALYYQNKNGARRALEVQVGRRLPPRGVIPAGRPVRVRVRKGGQAAHDAAARKDYGARIWDEGRPAGRWSDPSLRDW